MERKGDEGRECNQSSHSTRSIRSICTAPELAPNSSGVKPVESIKFFHFLVRRVLELLLLDWVFSASQVAQLFLAHHYGH